jgi:CheY-like chemotaxis protein
MSNSGLHLNSYPARILEGPNPMSTVLIVEDEVADLYAATGVVETLGFSVVAKSTAASAKAYLEAVVEKKETPPDLVILDLNLGYDSGHEVLRFWHKNREILNVRVVVWTQLGREQQELCELFKVDAVVSKWEGPEALKAAIKPLAAKAS